MIWKWKHQGTKPLCFYETQPNVALISEEVQAEGLKLNDVAELLAEAVCR